MLCFDFVFDDNIVDTRSIFVARIWLQTACSSTNSRWPNPPISVHVQCVPRHLSIYTFWSKIGTSVLLSQFQFARAGVREEWVQFLSNHRRRQDQRPYGGFVAPSYRTLHRRLQRSSCVVCLLGQLRSESDLQYNTSGIYGLFTMVDWYQEYQYSIFTSMSQLGAVGNVTCHTHTDKLSKHS